jgi:hypothetical protein
MAKVLRSAAIGGALVTTALLIPGSVAGAESDEVDDDDSRTLTFHVEFGPLSYTDFGDPGFSYPDAIVFQDELFEDGERVGHEIGSCVLVDAAGTSNCTGVVTLDGRGTITFAFENAPPPEKILAITGGSGDFRSVGGEGTLVEDVDQTGTLELSLDRP